MQVTVPSKDLTGTGRALIEFTDEQDRPLLLGPREEAARLGLRYRVIGVALRDARGRLYACKRLPFLESYPGLWDLSATGPVHAGESRERAARRTLAASLSLREVELKTLASFKPEHAVNRVQVTLFSARSRGEAPHPDPEMVSEGMFLDKDELTGLAQHFPELLTPALLWAIHGEWLHLQS